MELRFSPLFSGSSGNCVYVGCDEGGFLIDAGVSGKRILTAMHEMGIAPASIRGILVTHEHTDHIAGVGVMARKLDVPVYATEGTWAGMGAGVGRIDEKNRRVVTLGQNFFMGPIEVMAFPTLHDANAPCGYLAELGTSRFALATDTGAVRDCWLKPVLEADAVMLEANYDPDMLAAGSYPYALKQRIAGTHGHLSNDNAADAALTLVEHGTRHILLSHLSRENNFPQLAEQSVRLFLQMHGVNVGEDMALGVARRDGPTGVFATVSAWD